MASASRLVAAAMDRRSALAVAAEAPPSLPYAGNEPYALGLGVPPHLPPPPMDLPRSAPLKPPATGFLQFSGEQELSATAFGRALLDATRRVRATHTYRNQEFTWVCNICESAYSLSGVAPDEPEKRNAAKLGAGHTHPNYCQFCLHSWVKAKVEDNCSDIRCLMDKCNVPLDYTHMRTVLPIQLFKRWESVKLMTSLVSMPDLRWCPSCQEPAFMTPGCSAVSCPVCDFEFCPTCMLPKHAAIRCSAAVYEQDPDVQRRFYQERLCNQWKASHTKACPKCKAPTEKNEGCSHMTCRSCKYQYCWICLGPYLGKYVTGAAANGDTCPCPSTPPRPAAPPPAAAPAAGTQAPTPAAAGVRP